jgi:hypothetical protein
LPNLDQFDGEDYVFRKNPLTLCHFSRQKSQMLNS